MPAVAQPRGLTLAELESVAAEAGSTLPGHGGRRTDLSVSAARGTTTVVIEERYGELAGGMFGGMPGGVGGGVGIGGGTAIASALGSVAAAVAFPVAVVGGAYAACSAGYGAYVRRRLKRLHATCDAIDQELSETEYRHGATPSCAPVEPVTFLLHTLTGEPR